MELDYIIVGQGIAGSCFILELLQQNKTFVVIDLKSKNSASIVSSGLYNPIVLKRFTLVWKAEEQLKQLLQTYQDFEILLKQKYLQNQPVYRIFHNELEYNSWNKKSLREDLNLYLKTAEDNKNKVINSDYGIGRVLGTGRVCIQELLKDFRDFLINKNLILNEYFDYNKLKLNNGGNVVYGDLKAKRIVFCEGFGMKKNPFFKDLPLVGDKGEALLVKLKQPITDKIYKSKVTISHHNQDLNYIGATFNFLDKDISPSKESFDFLNENLTKSYNQEYQIIDHLVGIRPTVEDRRPLVGEHPFDKRLVIFNGLGTRGIMIAPFMAKKLFLLLEKNESLLPEASIRRFNTNFVPI